jgi:hypothetical protein
MLNTHTLFLTHRFFWGRRCWGGWRSQHRRAARGILESYVYLHQHWSYKQSRAHTYTHTRRKFHSLRTSKRMRLRAFRCEMARWSSYGHTYRMPQGRYIGRPQHRGPLGRYVAFSMRSYWDNLSFNVIALFLLWGPPVQVGKGVICKVDTVT